MIEKGLGIFIDIFRFTLMNITQAGPEDLIFEFPFKNFISWLTAIEYCFHLASH
jgi:hypothetical protein